MRTSELTSLIKGTKPRRINTRLLEDVEKLWGDHNRTNERRSKSNLVCYNAGIFVGGKKRGSISFSVQPPSYHATLFPMTGFVHLDGPTENELVRQIMEWVMREYIGATDIEVRAEKVATLCKKLNRELRSFSAHNQQNKVAPAGRTISRAYLPSNQGEERHA